MTDPVHEAETVVRRSDRRRLRRRAGIAAGALAVSLLTGGVWGGGGGIDSAQACTPITAGRAGTLPCDLPKNSPTDDAIEKFIGTTATGCVVGFVFGLGAGLLPGCVGGAVGNIAW